MFCIILEKKSVSQLEYNYLTKIGLNDIILTLLLATFAFNYFLRLTPMKLPAFIKIYEIFF